MDASRLIDKQIADLADPLRSEASWRGKILADLRKIIHEADPDIKEEWKWGTAVFMNKGNVCAIAGFKDHIKINFFKGASIKDTHSLFNNGLDAKSTRAIDFYKEDKVNETALKDLIREAVSYNTQDRK